MVLIGNRSPSGKGPPTYKICKGERTECRTVSYRVGDQSEGRLCREACGKPRGESNKQWTAYHCERGSKNCSAYEIFGRDDFDTTFDRHVKCVKMCYFVATVQHNSQSPIKLCSGAKNQCEVMKRVNGTFDALNMCAFKCDGWAKLENSKKHSTSFCDEDGNCQKGLYFSPPDAKKTFNALKDCFKNCMPGKLEKFQSNDQINKPRPYGRYVDDIFEIATRETNVTTLLDAVNQTHSLIRFTRQALCVS
nr:unnamed protein product [Spirometra erinaceieuropaei]